MFLPGSSELLKAVITDLSLVQSLRIPRELVQRIDMPIALLLDLLSCLLERLGHLAVFVNVL